MKSPCASSAPSEIWASKPPSFTAEKTGSHCLSKWQTLRIQTTAPTRLIPTLTSKRRFKRQRSWNAMLFILATASSLRTPPLWLASKRKASPSSGPLRASSRSLATKLKPEPPWKPPVYQRLKGPQNLFLVLKWPVRLPMKLVIQSSSKPLLEVVESVCRLCRKPMSSKVPSNFVSPVPNRHLAMNECLLRSTYKGLNTLNSKSWAMGKKPFTLENASVPSNDAIKSWLKKALG